MALINCPECGTTVSDKAQACPKCACPISGAATDTAEVIREQSTTYAPHPAWKKEPPLSQTVVFQQQERKSNGLGTAGFVLALISLCCSGFPGVGWFTWVLGFLFSFFGMFKSPRGLAVAGFLLSIIGLILLIAVFGTIASVFSIFS